LGRRNKIGQATIHSWVMKFGSNVKSPTEQAKLLGLNTKNRWGHIIYLDAKWLGKKRALLLAVDTKTLDIVAWLVCSGETERNYKRLVNKVQKCGYKIKAVVSDGEPSILALTQPKKPKRTRTGNRPFPRPGIKPRPLRKKAKLEGIPHQWCVVHAQRVIRGLIMQCRKTRRNTLRKLTNQTLFASTEKKAKRARRKLIKEFDHLRSDEWKVIKFLLKRWNLLMTHHKVRIDGKKIPRDTNGVENVISYLNTRLKTMRGLKSAKSATAIINLIVVNFRFKPLASAEKKWRKDKCPLELAGAKIEGLDWLDFCQKPTA